LYPSLDTHISTAFETKKFVQLNETFIARHTPIFCTTNIFFFYKESIKSIWTSSGGGVALDGCG